MIVQELGTKTKDKDRDLGTISTFIVYIYLLIFKLNSRCAVCRVLTPIKQKHTVVVYLHRTWSLMLLNKLLLRKFFFLQLFYIIISKCLNLSYLIPSGNKCS